MIDGYLLFELYHITYNNSIAGESRNEIAETMEYRYQSVFRVTRLAS